MRSNPPNSTFYRQQADETGRQAATAVLPMVKANLLEVERAWRVLAAGAADVERERLRPT